VTAAALDRVQAHVVRAVHTDMTYSAFYFLRIDDVDRTRELLDRLLTAELTMSDADARRRAAGKPPGRASVAVGFTYRGLKKLGVRYRPDDNQLAFGETDPYRDGMRKRAALLDDPDTTGWPGTGRQMLLWLGDEADARHQGELDRILDQVGFPEPHVEQGSHTPGDAVVLGYRDGTSQPFVSELASSPDRLPGGGTITPHGWRPVPLGEFVLGSTDAGEECLVPEPAWLTLGGTFVVYRKYVVDHQRFDDFLATAGSEYQRATRGRGDGAEAVAAKVLGRYRVGQTPPGGPAGYDAVIPAATSPGAGPQGPNDFRYGSDTYGHSCPLGSHIRRANPRDALGFDGDLVARHRIIRRGVPWDEGGRQGLHFVGVNARIQDQFEFIQRQWLNTGASFRLGGDIDLIAGSPPRRAGGSDEAAVHFVIHGTEPVLVRAPAPFATLEGGEYFLVPGIDGIRWLAQGGP
jgi:deferrochelatase/peroxidase EfeB